MNGNGLRGRTTPTLHLVQAVPCCMDIPAAAPLSTELFASHGYAVPADVAPVAPDFIGHGHSPLPKIAISAAIIRKTPGLHQVSVSSCPRAYSCPARTQAGPP